MTDQPSEPRKRRLSITRLQRQTETATELIALCQTVTEDGHLEEQEVQALREWLDANKQSDLPAIGFLTETAERILADGRVTGDECRELYLAIESVLPPDLRESVRGTRLDGERAYREVLKNEAAAAKLAAAESRRRDRPLARYDFMVAGCSHEGRSEIVRQSANVGDRVFLIRDPQNRYSRNAVEIRLKNGMCVGYVPERLAANDIAKMLDTGCKQIAAIKKILNAHWGTIPVVVLSLYQVETMNPSAISQGHVPDRVVSEKPGCFAVIMAVLIVFFSLSSVWLFQ